MIVPVLDYDETRFQAMQLSQLYLSLASFCYRIS